MRKAFLSSDKDELARASWEAFRESEAYQEYLTRLGVPSGSEVPASFIAGWHLGFVCALAGIEQGGIIGVGPPTKPGDN